MDLLTGQQAQHHWFEADLQAKFDDLLEALGLYKDISTEYGLNQSVHQQWRFGDPHKKSGDPDRLFFRPTPYGFRQVVQHVTKHVAFGIN